MTWMLSTFPDGACHRFYRAGLVPLEDVWGNMNHMGGQCVLHLCSLTRPFLLWPLLKCESSLHHLLNTSLLYSHMWYLLQFTSILMVWGTKCNSFVLYFEGVSPVWPRPSTSIRAVPKHQIYVMLLSCPLKHTSYPDIQFYFVSCKLSFFEVLLVSQLSLDGAVHQLIWSLCALITITSKSVWETFEHPSFQWIIRCFL